MDKILIIEDSRAQAEYLKSILSDDYEVTICLEGEEGFRKAKGDDFSLIFLDIIMPDVDGFTLLKKFQETILTKYTPVILVSGLPLSPAGLTGAPLTAHFDTSDVIVDFEQAGENYRIKNLKATAP